MEFKVGQLVYSRDNDKIKEHKITKVGKKYFYLYLDGDQLKVDKNTLDYLGHKFVKFYLTKEELEEKILRTKLVSSIKELVEKGELNKLTILQLKEVSKVLNII